jgi:S-adenosylmethionine:tRNA ribosyltransferase-isomerase
VKTSEFDYFLPPELIAQTPLMPRDAARLLVLPRFTGKLEHRIFREIGEYLQPNDVLVVNQTRVIPARLYAHKLPGGGKVEILLLRRIEPQLWETWVGGKGLDPGRQIQVENGPLGEVEAVLEGPKRLIRFREALKPSLNTAGHIPLPPYITTPLTDPERYQTVFAREEGSAAAPTAGLHFTPELIRQLNSAGIHFASLTLHIGLDTFAPVTEANPQEHKIHTEWCRLAPDAADRINSAKRRGGRIIAVGTTSVRTLETAARVAPAGKVVEPYEGATDLFILPGYKFLAVDAMITNFHLPKSTLIMLVSAFAGKERIMAAYETARQMRYRFYSFGDAMLII